MSESARGADQRMVRAVGPVHRAQDLLIAGIAGLLRMVPEPVALASGWGLGWFVGSVLRIRRGVVDRNLELAFPDASPRWRRRIASRVFPHLGREAITILRLVGADAAELRDRVRVEGLDLLQEALAEGNGVVIATGHLGNWEIGGGATAAWGVPLDAVVQRQRNPAFDHRIRRVRESLGVRIIYRHEATRGVLRALREGRAVALLADQHAARSDLKIDFFGVPARTARGPAVFAARTGAPMFLAEVFRRPGMRRARYDVRFARLQPLPDAEDEAEDVALLRAYMSALEEGIRKAPEQYFWPHNRWKS